MRTQGIWWALAAFLFAAAAALPVQLPPEIEVDRRLLAAREAVAAGEWIEAHNSLVAAEKIKDEQSLELPPEFWFLRAQVFFVAAEYDEAIDATTQYLTLTGRGGESYGEALELLNRAEEENAAAEAEARRAEARASAIREALDGIEFVRIPPGEFLMGSTDLEADESERRLTRVRISRPFDLGKYEVTQGQWEAVMGSNPSNFARCGRDCPVENVSWDDAKLFISQLNLLSALHADGAEYRLPTEAVTVRRVGKLQPA